MDGGRGQDEFLARCSGDLLPISRIMTGTRASNFAELMTANEPCPILRPHAHAHSISVNWFFR